MKGCKVEGSKFIRVDAIWRILDARLIKFGTKMLPSRPLESENETMGLTNAQDGAKWIP